MNPPISNMTDASAEIDTAFEATYKALDAIDRDAHPDVARHLTNAYMELQDAAHLSGD